MENYKIKKVANAIIYFLDNQVKFLGSTKLMKMLFFADKFYINEFAKPIFNFSYIKKERGPVPTEVHSIIKSIQANTEDLDYEEEIKAFSQYIKILRLSNSKERQNTQFNKLADFNSDFFSDREIQTLDKIIEKFKEADKKEISDISHNENCWIFANKNERIEFFSMADDKETQEFMLDNLKTYQSFKQKVQK